MRTALRHILSKLATTLALAACISLVSTSCTSDPEDNGKPGVGGKEEKAYLSFRLTTGHTESGDRNISRMSIGDNDYNDADYRVDTVRVVLYGPDDLVHYTFDFSIKSTLSDEDHPDFMEGDFVDPVYGHDLYSSSLASDETTSFVTYARKVAENDYRMLVIVNGAGRMEEGAATRSMGRSDTYTNIYDLTNPGQAMSLLYEPVRRDKEFFFENVLRGRSIHIPQNSSIMMTNYQDLIYVKAEQLGNSIQDANENPIFARVERYLAKIIVTTANEDGSIELRGDVSNGQITYERSWALDCTNKWFYWMRQMAPMIEKNGTQGSYETVNYDPATPLTKDTRLRMYAIDPNFDGLSSHNGGTQQQKRKQFNYLQYDNEYSGSYLGNNFDSEEYILENTMAPDEQYPDVMTKVLIQLQLSPDIDIVTSPYDGYFTFENNSGTETIITRLDMESYLADQNNIPAHFQPGLETAINNIRADGEVDIDNIFYGSVDSGFDLHGLKYYHQCHHYFMVPIRHYDDFEGYTGTEGMEYGRYGVVRNNIYKVKIRSVSGPGSPDISSPAFLAADIGITPWLRHAQEEDLGSGVKPVNPYVSYKYYYETSKGATVYLGAKYIRNAAVGDIIETDSRLNDMKDDIPGGSDGYKDGELLATPPTNVSADNASNVVEIIYRPENARQAGFEIYHIDWNMDMIFPGMSITSNIFQTTASSAETVTPSQFDLQLPGVTDYKFTGTTAIGKITNGEVCFDAQIDAGEEISRTPEETAIIILCYKKEI